MFRFHVVYTPSHRKPTRCVASAKTLLARSRARRAPSSAMLRRDAGSSLRRRNLCRIGSRTSMTISLVKALRCPAPAPVALSRSARLDGVVKTGTEIDSAEEEEEEVAALADADALSLRFSMAEAMESRFATPGLPSGS